MKASRKIFSVILMVIMLLQAGSVYASSIERIYAKMDGYNIVSGGVSPFGEGHTVTIAITYGNDNQVIYFNFMETEANGEFEFVCALDPTVNSSGTYNVVIGGGGLDKSSTSVDFYDTNDEEIIIDRIKNSTIANMGLTLQNEAEKVGIDLSGTYSKIHNKEKIYNEIKNGTYKTFSELKEFFEEVVIMQRFNEISPEECDEELKELAEVIEIDLDEIFNSIKTEEGRENVYEAICSKNLSLNKNEFCKTFNSAAYISLINELDTGDRNALLEYIKIADESDMFDFDLEEYENLSGDNRRTVLLQTLKKIPFNSFQELSEIFDDEIKEVATKKITTSRGGSSGGGGGVKIELPLKSADNISQDIGENQPAFDNIDENFSDIDIVPWAKNEINYLSQRGIIKGRGNGKFDPESFITREEFVKILVEALEIPDMPTEKVLVDVDENSWYYESVMKAYAAGIVQGVDFERFGTGELITREQVCTIILRAMQLMDADILVPDMAVSISDRDEISEYAIQAVESMYRANIVSGIGNGMFNPKGQATRAQIAKIICGVMERMGDL